MRNLILCDSCCDFTASEKFSTGFSKIAATVRVSGTALTDDEDFKQEALLQALKTPSLELKIEFPDIQAYLDAFSRGAEEIYVVTGSAALGDYYETASRARREFLQTHPQTQIHVFNTRTTGAGELLAARKISQMLRSGCGFRQIVERVERYILEVGTFFLTACPGQLRELGLIGPPRPFQPNHLALKMDLCGCVKILGGALTEKAAERQLLKDLAQQKNLAGKTCLLAHCGCPERARRLAQLLRKAGLFGDVLFLETGAVNSLILGKGGITLAY